MGVVDARGRWARSMGDGQWAAPVADLVFDPTLACCSGHRAELAVRKTPVPSISVTPLVAISPLGR